MNLTLALLAGALLLVPGCRGKQQRSAQSPPAASPAPAAAPGPDYAREVAALPEVSELPDPFLMPDGQRVRTRARWERRRQQLVGLLQRYQYGRAPSPVRFNARQISSEPTLGGQARKRTLLLTGGPGGGLRIYVGLLEPVGEGPYTATVLHIDHRGLFEVAGAEKLMQRGLLVAGFDPGYLDANEGGVGGPARSAYPKQDWGTLAIWAWGASRVLDHLLTLPRVDPGRIVVTGHSRSGKAALLCGALDRRVALTVPQGSGCAGAAAYRFYGQQSETLAHITRTFPHWFHPRLRAFAGQERRLPFDQHFLLALVAPRALLSIDALGDAWGNPLGTQQAHRAARPVYEFLGARHRLGIHFRPGTHELSAADWQTLADFAEKTLLGKAPGDGQTFQRLPFPDEAPGFSWGAPKE